MSNVQYVHYPPPIRRYRLAIRRSGRWQRWPPPPLPTPSYPPLQRRGVSGVVNGWAMLAMLAMLTAFFGHLRGVGGRCRAIGPIPPPNRPTSPQIAPLAGCGLMGWWRGSAMQGMREKKPQAMGAMCGGEGASPPQNRTTAPRYPARHTPAILAGAGGGWVVAGGPDRLAVSRFRLCFFRLRAQFFFFFCETRPPVPIRSADIFPIFFLTALTGFNAANGP